jgi:hypothetical protein
MKRYRHPRHGYHVLGYGDDPAAFEAAGWVLDVPVPEPAPEPPPAPPEPPPELPDDTAAIQAAVHATPPGVVVPPAARGPWRNRRR